MSNKPMQGYKPSSVLGSTDKAMSTIFAAVLISILLWIGATTHRNTVMLATVVSKLESTRDVMERRLQSIERRLDRDADKIEKVLRHIGKDLD